MGHLERLVQRSSRAVAPTECRMTGHRHRILWVVALTAALLVPGSAPAGAHTHPTPIERSAPGVVWVEARATVEVALVEHRQSDPGGLHISITQSTSDPLLAWASGFVVEPTGSIVTSGAITKNDLDRASIYAVNEAFRNRYGAQAPMTGDLFTRQRVGPDTDLLQQRLAACYPPYQTNDAGGCVVKVTPTYVVYPYVNSQDNFGRLPATLLAGSTNDVAVLKVKATSMPTVALGESTAGAKALAALGFMGVPGEQQQLQSIYAHLAEVGGTVLKTEGLTEEEAKDNAQLAESLGSGWMHGGPVVAEEGQVIGFLEPDANSAPAPGRLIDVGAIRGVLSEAGVTPRRGPVDTSFEAAMHPFKNGGYAAAIPSFKATLALFPGHFLAAANLAVAEQNVASGTPGASRPTGGGTTATSSAGSPWTVVLFAVAAVLLLAAIALLILRRRRRSHASPAGRGTPSPGTAKPREGQPAAPSRPAAGKREPGKAKPQEGQPAVASRPATGKHEHRGAPSTATGSKSGAVSVIEAGGPGQKGPASPRGGEPAVSGVAPSRSAPEQGAGAPVGDGSRRAARGYATPPPVPSSGRDAPFPPATDRPAFCTSCGGPLAPRHRYCSRCGAATGVTGR